MNLSLSLPLSLLFNHNVAEKVFYITKLPTVMEKTEMLLEKEKGKFYHAENDNMKELCGLYILMPINSSSIGTYYGARDTKDSLAMFCCRDV